MESLCKQEQNYNESARAPFRNEKSVFIRTRHTPLFQFQYAICPWRLRRERHENCLVLLQKIVHVRYVELSLTVITPKIYSRKIIVTCLFWPDV